MLYQPQPKKPIQYITFEEKQYIPCSHQGFDTKTIHQGQEPQKIHGAVNVPIYASTTYAQHAPGSLYSDFDYTRCGNPTRKALEKCIAACDYAKHGIIFSSGCAATSTIFSLFQSGSHFIVTDDCYGGTQRFLRKFAMQKFKFDVDFVDMVDLKNITDKIKQNTKLIWLQTPTNPLMKLIDLKGVSQIAKKNNLLTVGDNTFASPYLQSPILLGIDICYHSCSKYINGHSDVIMGALSMNDKELHDKILFAAKTLGGCPSPFDCYLCLRGIKTLGTRMRTSTKNAYHIAHYLEKHPLVQKLYYPGLKSFPQYQLATQQMRGFGSMMTFLIKGEQKQARKFLSSMKVFTLAQSLGGVQSLAEHPASMTHGSVPIEHRKLIGITDNLIRISVGIQNLQDLLMDIQNALQQSQK